MRTKKDMPRNSIVCFRTFCLLAIVWVSVVKAQKNAFQFGLEFGFNGVHIEGDNGRLYSSEVGEISGTGGISIAMNVRRPLSRRIYGVLELRYSRKGSIFKFYNPYQSLSFESLDLDYLEIPVMLGYQFNTKWQPVYFESGFSFSRLISSNFKLDVLNAYDPSVLMSGFRDVDLSWISKVNSPVFGGDNFLLGLMFSYSLTSVHQNYNLRNMNYGIVVGWLF